jgi:hypothetical protein
MLEYLDWYKQLPPLKPWILGGDFNLITTLQDKKGGCISLTQEDICFKEFIENNDMIDLETSNGIFTWNNK